MWFWLTLFFSNREYHRRAFEEVFVVAVVSIVPLLLLPFIASLKSGAEAPFDLLTTIWPAISSGQLYLYSFSMLGMIIWLSVEDVSNKPFPPRKYFIVVALLWPAPGLVDTRLSESRLHFELYGAQISDRRVPAFRIIEAFDVVEHVSLGLIARAIRFARRALGL